MISQYFPLSKAICTTLPNQLLTADIDISLEYCQKPTPVIVLEDDRKARTGN